VTTKNKHHHRPACAGLWPQVFRGGPFGVWGTPPPKPLNCKVWEILDGALAIHACRSGSSLSASKSVADPFVAVIQIKNPAHFSVSRVCENLFLLLPAYLQSIRIDRDFTVSFGQTKAKHTTGLTMTCRLRD
jgi:hypothetical protein